MTTIGVRYLKAQTSEVLRRVEEGEEFVVTRRGRPCAKLIPAAPPSWHKPPTLKPMFPDLPDASWDDFMEAKQIWHRISHPKLPDE